MLSKAFKILGEFNDEDGAGVVGHNTADSGTAIGVEGKTESNEGYGLFTEDDARVEGELTTTAINTDRTSIDQTYFKPDALEREKNVTGRYGTAGERKGAMLSSGAVFHSHVLYRDITTTTYSSDGTVREINVQPFVHPPELIPILYVDVMLRNQSTGEDANLQVSMEGSAGNPPVVAGGVTGTNLRRIYDETYLADFLNHTDTGTKKKMPSLSVEGTLTGGTGEFEQLVIGLKYEVR